MKELEAMKVTGMCDACHTKPATQWFGNTSCATCGDSKCIAVLQEQREQMEEEMRWEND